MRFFGSASVLEGTGKVRKMKKNHGIDTTTVGGRIKYWRWYAGINQEELAEKMFTSKQMISAYETNKVDVKASVLIEIADVLGIEVGWLFADQFDKKVNENGNYDTEELLTMYDLLPEEMQKVAIEQMKSLLSYCERTAVR